MFIIILWFNFGDWCEDVIFFIDWSDDMCFCLYFIDCKECEDGYISVFVGVFCGCVVLMIVWF